MPHAACLLPLSCTPPQLLSWHRLVQRNLTGTTPFVLCSRSFVVFTEILMVNSYGSWKDASFSGARRGRLPLPSMSAAPACTLQSAAQPTVNHSPAFPARFAENAAYRLSFVCFFGGVLITAALDAVVHVLMHWVASRKGRRAAAETIELQRGKSQQVHPVGQHYEAVQCGSDNGDVETGSCGATDCKACEAASGSSAGNRSSDDLAPACCLEAEGAAPAAIASGTVSLCGVLLCHAWHACCAHPAGVATAEQRLCRAQPGGPPRMPRAAGPCRAGGGVAGG